MNALERSMTEIAFLHHYGPGTAHSVTLYNDHWPATIELHQDVWRDMLERKLLPWAVANITFDQLPVDDPFEHPKLVVTRKDGRVQFSMADGRWAEYGVTRREADTGTLTAQYLQEGHQLPPRELR